ncbi:MAG: class I SAM-dependent methyltransferase [Patescibacteria group bacterium]|nr:class I SAM-dependent methyltransferase [Patescibacteria group bacterium]
MQYDQHLHTQPWGDYELLDSGDGMKLERFGDVVVARPETQALWSKLRPELWKTAHAEFAFHEKKGEWHVKKSVPAKAPVAGARPTTSFAGRDGESWQISWNAVRLLVRLTGFKHTGLFPEQAPNWQWLSERCRDIVHPASDVGHSMSHMPQVLNLFGYTGVASLAAGHAGAFVTHVDASKQSLDWAHENARLSEIPEGRIRWMLDDALAFAKREARRGAKYDGIILDPPAFGRGAKGEVWKIEENLPALLASLKELLSEKSGSFFLLNGYAAGYAPRSFAQAVESAFGEIGGECGELLIRESASERVVPAGIYVRFAR